MKEQDDAKLDEIIRRHGGRPVKTGDLVRLCPDPGVRFDWQDPVTGARGYYLRDPITHEQMMHATGDFMDGEVCLVLEASGTVFGVKVLTPRSQIGMIQPIRLEVVSAG